MKRIPPHEPMAKKKLSQPNLETSTGYETAFTSFTLEKSNPQSQTRASIPSLKYPVPQLSRPSIIPSLEGLILRVSPLMRVPSFVSPLPKTPLPRVDIPRSHIAVYMQLTYRTQETVYGSSIHVRIVHYSCFDHICWSADCCSDQS